MKSQAFIIIAIILVCSVLAEGEVSRAETKEVAHEEIRGDEPRHTDTFGGYGGGLWGYHGKPSTGGVGGGTGSGVDGGAGNGATDGGAGGGAGNGATNGGAGGGAGNGATNGGAGGGAGNGASNGGYNGGTSGGDGGASGSGADGVSGNTAGGYSSGFSHGGVYGGGQVCKFGCCSESYGYSHDGGGYYGCTCCRTIAEAKAYKENQVKA